MKTSLRYIIYATLFFASLSCSGIFDDMQHAKVDFQTELGLHITDISIPINKSFKINKDTLIPGMPEPDIYLLTNNDDVLTFRLKQPFPPLILDSILDMSQASFDDTIAFPAIFGFFIEGTLNFGFQLKTFNNEMLEGKLIDSLKFDAGRLSLQFNTFNQFYSEFNITFPGISDENKKVLKIEDFTPTEQNNTIDLDLSNHKIEVLRKNGKEYFIIGLDFYIESLDDEAPENPMIKINMGDLDLDFAYGSFGTDSIADFGKQSIALPGPLIEGQDISFNFDQPEIKLSTHNSFALPFRFKIKNVDMHFPDSQVVAVTGFPENVDINAPTTSTVNDTVTSTLQLDPSTNFDILLSEGPNLLTIDGNLWTNPDDPLAKNYIRDQDNLATALELNIPFKLNVSGIVLRDTSATSVFRELDNESIRTEKIKIKAFLANSIPFDLNLQAYFLDEYDNVVDSLFDESTFIEGPSNDDGTRYKLVYVEKDREQIEKLFEVQKTAVVARLKTADAEKNRIVSFKASQTLDIGLTVFSRLNINTGND